MTKKKTIKPKALINPLCIVHTKQLKANEHAKIKESNSPAANFHTTHFKV
jgi:hypothetical protein